MKSSVFCRRGGKRSLGDTLEDELKIDAPKGPVKSLQRKTLSKAQISKRNRDKKSQKFTNILITPLSGVYGNSVR